MLPFGLFTEVSAGALGAGAGAGIGAAGVGAAAAPFPALPGNPSAFAAALSASAGAAQAGVLPDGQAIPGLDLKSRKAAADGTEGLPAGLEALLPAVPAAQTPAAIVLDLDGEGGAVDIDGAGLASASAEAGAKAGAANGANGATGAGTPPAGGFIPQLPTASTGDAGGPQTPVDPSLAGKGQSAPSGLSAGPLGDQTGKVASTDVALADDAAPVPAKAGDTTVSADGETTAAEAALKKGAAPDVQPSGNGVPEGKSAAVSKSETASVKDDGQQSSEPQRTRRWQSELPEAVRSTLLKQSLAADAASAAQAGNDTSEGVEGVNGAADGSKKVANAAGELPAVPVSGKAKMSSVSAQGAGNANEITAASVSNSGSGPVDPDAVDPQTEAVDLKPAQPQAADAKQTVADNKAASESPALDAANRQIAKKAFDQAASDQVAADNAALDDPDAVDPGEPVPASEKSSKGTSTADSAGDKASATSGNTASRAAERLALAAAANAGAFSQAADPDADPDGQLTLALNMRADGSGSQMVTGRADMQQSPTQAQAAHVATQVASGIVRHLQNGQTRFQMRLDPPELGRVDVDLKVAHDGRVHAHLIVDRPETLDMFMRDQRGLERALQNAGLDTNADNLSFSLNDNGSQQSGFSWGNGEQGDTGDAAGPVAEDSPELTDSQNIQMAVRTQQGGLDIRI